MSCTQPVMVIPKTARGGETATGRFMYIPCGRCLDCKKSKARLWSYRIMHECRFWDDSLFVTLTYKEECLPPNGTLVKHHMQDFFKRLRKRLGREIKYFLGGEYGELQGRPHYHAVIFGVSREDVSAIEQSWTDGFVHVGDVTADSASYVAGYTLKKLYGADKQIYVDKGIIPEFVLMSRRPGIGARYVERNKKFLKNNVCLYVNGKKVALPRYYKDKLFTSEERSLLNIAMQEEYDKSFEETKTAAGVKEGFEVLDYQRGQRAQRDTNLKVRESLKGRKI